MAGVRSEVVRVDVTSGAGSVAAVAARGIGHAAVAQLRPAAAPGTTFVLPKEAPPGDGDSAPAGMPGNGPEPILDVSRRHQEEERRWRSLRATGFEPDPRSDLGAAGFGARSPVRLSRWVRPVQELPATRRGGELDSVVVTFIGVEGAQIGHHNEQVNVRRYHLEPDIDLAAALRDERVRQAFTDYALNPGDPAGRREAVAALRAVRTGPATDWTVAEHEAVVTRETSGPAGLLPGTIVLTDCRGVQVGNHLRQYNTFTYVCAPSVATHDLFRRNPKLVEAVVDYACVPGTRGIGSVQRRLSDAVCGDAEKALAREPGSGRLPVRSMSVEGGQSLTMGTGATRWRSSTWRSSCRGS